MTYTDELCSRIALIPISISVHPELNRLQPRGPTLAEIVYEISKSI